ncbi:hypothetical protein GGR51DRAFT_560546 [Nemania sp. FL0031]|nr:hypothetical protein GGR51DRAFT_560546 [Nemania sp. FL0031]
MASPQGFITINPNGDASVVVSETSNTKKEEIRFRVSRSVVEELKLPGDKPEIRLTGNDVASLKTVELLLRCMELKYSKGTLPDVFYAVSITEVWCVLTLVDIKALRHFRPGWYRVPCSVLQTWFDTWFKQQQPTFTKREDYEQLLYPTFAFDNAAAFAAVTKWLAYDVVGQIREYNPLVGEDRDDHLSFRLYGDMHMPKDVIRVIRGSKAALRDKLIQLLDKSEQVFIHSFCRCRIQGLANFTEALLKPYNGSQQTLLHRTPLRDVLLALTESFEYEPPTGADGCRGCGTEVRGRMVAGAREIMELFDGICITCMNRLVNMPEDYRPSTSDVICAWHGEMTWKLSDIRPPSALPRRPKADSEDSE